MAHEILGRVVSLVAYGDLSSYQYRFVKLTTSGKAALVAAATDDVVGVLQNKPIDGRIAAVMVDGVSKVYSGAAIANSGAVMADTTGRAIAWATTGNKGQGFNLDTPDAAGEQTTVLLKSLGKH